VVNVLKPEQSNEKKGLSRIQNYRNKYLSTEAHVMQRNSQTSSLIVAFCVVFPAIIFEFVMLLNQCCSFVVTFHKAFRPCSGRVM